MVCGFNSSSTGSYYGHFSYCFNQNDQKNEVKYVSFSKCSDSSIGATISYVISYGYQIFSNTNSSFNIAKESSGVAFCYPNSLISNYCTFSNNNSTSKYVIELRGGSNLKYFNNSNFISNNSPNDGIFSGTSTGSDYLIQFSIFSLNSQVLFYSNYCNLIILNCFINHNNNYIKI